MKNATNYTDENIYTSANNANCTDEHTHTSENSTSPSDERTHKNITDSLTAEELAELEVDVYDCMEADSDISEYTGIYKNDKGEYKINATEFAESFTRNNRFFFLLSTSNATIKYVYDKCGVYREVSDDVFKGLIKNKLPPELQKTGIIKEIFELIKMDKSIYIPAENINADENIINFRNGILHLDTKEIAPHTPDVLSTIQIPCNYNEDAPSPDTEYFMTFLMDLTSESSETVQLLLEFIGLTISNIKGYRTKKALFLVGEGNTGKSQFRKVLTSLIGEENDTSIDLEAMEGRFGGSQLLYKRLAGSNDMKFATVGQLGMFKQLTGGDRIYAEKKGKDGFTMSYNGLLCFCTNGMPRFGGDKGDHVYERFLIVECNNIIPPNKRDPKIVEKILTEKEFIVSLAVSQLYTLMDNNFNFTIPEKCRKALNRYKVDNDNVLGFMEECTEYQPLDTIGDGLKTSEVYQMYVSWCRDNNEKCYGRKLFNTRLSELGKGERRKSHGNEYYTAFKVKREVVKEYYKTAKEYLQYRNLI